jgi:hypothetical protein
MRNEKEDFQTACSEILLKLADGESEPDQVIAAVQAKQPLIFEETIRGAIWHLLDFGNIEATWQGTLKLKTP